MIRGRELEAVFLAPHRGPRYFIIRYQMGEEVILDKVSGRHHLIKTQFHISCLLDQKGVTEPDVAHKMVHLRRGFVGGGSRAARIASSNTFFSPRCGSHNN